MTQKTMAESLREFEDKVEAAVFVGATVLCIGMGLFVAFLIGSKRR